MLAALVPRAAAATPADTLRVAVVLPADTGDLSTAAARGIALGVQEAARTAALFALALDVQVQRERTHDERLAAASGLLARPVAALVGGLDDADCGALAALAAERRVLFLGLGCAANQSPPARCERFALLLGPTDAAVARARAAFARRAGATTAHGASIVLWHGTLRRFGAEQLNDRFRRRFGSEMTSAAWAGWLAMKVLGEASLRARSTSPDAIARHLTGRSTRFDGHKGTPLVFDAQRGELRQPLYVVARSTTGDGGGHVVAELSPDTAFGPADAPGGEGTTCQGGSR